MLKAIQKLLARPLKLLDNKYIAGGLQIFLILYASMIAPSLPKFLEDALKNPAIKVLLLSLIIYLSNKNIALSLSIAIGFVLSMAALRELEQARRMKDLIKIAIKVPREAADEIIDGIQAIPEKAAQRLGRPAEQVVGGANKIIDAVQGAAGDIIDTVQEAVL